MFYWFIIFSVCCEAGEINVHQESHLVYFSQNWKVEGDCDSSWTASGSEKKFTTCLPNAHTTQNCSLISEYWSLNNMVNTIFVNIGGEGHKCSDIGRSDCVDDFVLKVLYNENNTAYFVSNIPPNNESMIETKQNSGFYSYHAMLPIDVVRVSKLKFIFQSSYFCGDIGSFKVVYYDCPTISDHLVKFKWHAAPTPSDRPLNINGECIAHSVSLNSKKEPSMQCYYNGTYKVSGECHCYKGFEKTKKIECKGIIFPILNLFIYNFCIVFILDVCPSSFLSLNSNSNF